MNLATMVRTSAQRLPDVAAIVEAGEIVTWAELDRRIAAAAWHLREHGVRSGDVVLIAVRSATHNAVLLFAASRLGAAACILDWRTRPAEQAAIRAAVAPRLLLVDRPVADADASTVVVGPAWRAAPGEPGPIADDPDLVAILSLSSGTTGLPKALIVPQRVALYRAMQRALENDLRPGRRLLAALPPSAVTSIQALLGQVLTGATAWHVPSLASTDELLELMRRERIEQTTLVPAMVRDMLGRPADQGLLLPDIAALRVVGAAFHPEEKREVMARITPNLYDSYGAAVCGAITRATPQDLRARPASVGRAVLQAHVEIVDEAGSVLPAGEIGRVRVRHLGAATGYWGNTGAAERDEVIRDGYVYPGDLGRLDADGYLYLEGRAASLIIRGGQNVFPEEVERVLLTHDAVAEAAVIGRPDAVLGEVPAALVVLRTPLSTGALLAWCHARLQSHKVPVIIRVVDALPRNAGGKVTRSALAALLET